MSIIEKFKQVLATKEAKALKREIKKTTKKTAAQAKEAAGTAYSVSKEVAGDVVDRAGDTIESMRSDKITYDVFKRVEVRVGTIMSVEKIEKSDKLLKLMVNVGEDEPRQIVSGIAPYFKDEQVLAGRQAMFVTNLEPRTIFGYESNGMIFAVNDENSFSILEPDTTIAPGTLAS